ncbi:ribonuclease domain-containing protein [Saccharothrix obliqua]|uniref:ribonuclease domain-containing protein n=1 Tax=Saccharothrix obliqua TaxID=2861747 RepID=UPI001C5D3D59|nr:ribonuclease domain-containing protein [Saccharothrix obliqua]MBW4717235.1 hypothetical protein [Saccharothrix obliqua]
MSGTGVRRLRCALVAAAQVVALSSAIAVGTAPEAGAAINHAFYAATERVRSDPAGAGVTRTAAQVPQAAHDAVAFWSAPAAGRTQVTTNLPRPAGYPPTSVMSPTLSATQRWPTGPRLPMFGTAQPFYQFYWEDNTTNPPTYHRAAYGGEHTNGALDEKSFTRCFNDSFSRNDWKTLPGGIPTTLTAAITAANAVRLLYYRPGTPGFPTGQRGVRKFANPYGANAYSEYDVGTVQVQVSSGQLQWAGTGRGRDRLVRNNVTHEVYYTDDHYCSFTFLGVVH